MRHRNYKNYFKKAFGDPKITGERILLSLAQFQLTLVSAGSKYDDVKTKKTRYTEQEMAGYKLFQKHCNHCHTEPLFSNFQFAKNGLTVDTTLNDIGRKKISLKEQDIYLFKTPSLRNLSYTAPYMHDGRFKNLTEVLKHYTERSENPILLNPKEKIDLITFLLTLNDKEFIFAKKHQFPSYFLKELQDSK